MDKFMTHFKEQFISALSDNFLSNITAYTISPQFLHTPELIEPEKIDKIFYFKQEGVCPYYQIETYFTIKRKHYLLNLKFKMPSYHANILIGKNVEEIKNCLKAIGGKNYFTNNHETILIELEKVQVETSLKQSKKLISNDDFQTDLNIKTKIKI